MIVGLESVGLESVGIRRVRLGRKMHGARVDITGIVGLGREYEWGENIH